MGTIRRCATVIAATVMAAAMHTACTLPPLETSPESASIRPSPSPTATPAPSASPTRSGTPSPAPAAVVPDFAAGEIVEATIDGLRVRGLPGVDRPIVTGLLPLAFQLEVVMGPIEVDDLGWYLVRDVDTREPDFDEGWVAAGTDPEPLLRATGRAAEDPPYVAAMDGTGDAEQGPIELADGDHTIRWIALDPERTRCSFGVSFSPAGGGDLVPAIRATVGTGVDRGTLQSQSFAALELPRSVFAAVDSDCAWALVIVRVRPDSSTAATPAP